MWIGKVVKHGHCEALTLPRRAREASQLSRGDYCVIRFAGGVELVIDRIDPADLPRLRDRLAGKDEDLP